MDFCVSCGKKELFKENLCEKCYVKYNPDLKKVKQIVLDVCVECNKYQAGHQWLPLKDVETALRSLVKKNTNLKNAKIEFEIPEEKKKKVSLNVFITTSGDQYVLPAVIHYTFCPSCQRKKTAYYEGVIQLRKPSKQLLEVVENQLAQRGVHIIEKKKVRNGIDYVIDSRAAGVRLLKLLKQKYHGITKTAKKLFTEDKQTSKKVYRWTFLFKMFPYGKGDSIRYKGKNLKIKSIAKSVTCVEEETNKKVLLSYKELEKAKVF